MSRLHRICSVENCERKHYGRGYCNAHYIRWRANRPMDTPVFEYQPMPCKHEPCDETATGKGYCSKHYRRWKAGGDMDAPTNPYRQVGCLVPGCSRAHDSLGYCRRHYGQQKRYNLTVDQMIEFSNRNCEICDIRPAVVVDHDHSCCPGENSCGRCVRGVLCHTCNQGLGAFRDNVNSLSNAIAYLSK